MTIIFRKQRFLNSKWAVSSQKPNKHSHIWILVSPRRWCHPGDGVTQGVSQGINKCGGQKIWEGDVRAQVSQHPSDRGGMWVPSTSVSQKTLWSRWGMAAERNPLKGCSNPLRGEGWGWSFKGRGGNPLGGICENPWCHQMHVVRTFSILSKVSPMIMKIQCVYKF